MFVIVNGKDLQENPALSGLAADMFTDRAIQFRHRLGWPVHVDPLTGQERDEYDLSDSTYVIIHDESGGHLGSMRLRSTRGAVMINDHFSHLLPETCVFASDAIWESTRFCLSPRLGDGRVVAARLMFAAAGFALAQGITAYVAVFDARMVPIYKRIGWPPNILGDACSSASQAHHAGRWDFSADCFARSSRAAKLSAAEEASLKNALSNVATEEQVGNKLFS